MSLMNAGLPNQPDKVISPGVPVGAFSLMPSGNPQVTMADGSEWLREGLVLPAASYPVAQQLDHLRGHLFSRSGLASGTFSAVASNGAGTFVACNPGLASIYSSTDGGATWVARTIGWGTANPSSVIWTGSIFVAIGNDGGIGNLYAATSSDGITWTQNTVATGLTGAQTNAIDLATNGSIIVISVGGAPSAQAFYTSTTGLNGSWTARASGSGASLSTTTRLSGGGLGFLLTAPGLTAAQSSTDGITWTSRTLPAGAVGGNISEVVITSTTAVVPGNTAGQCFVSSDFASWATGTLSSSSIGVGFIVKNSSTSWSAFGTDGSIYRTSDGITWNVQAAADTNAAQPSPAGNRYVCIGSNAIVQLDAAGSVAPSYAISIPSASNGVGGAAAPTNTTGLRGMWRIK